MPAQEPSPTSTASHGPLLRADGLACRRGDRLLFKDLDLQIDAGQILWIRGANGRGKTSLLRLLSGLSSPTQGEIHWKGQKLRAAGGSFKQQLVYIGHANGLKDDLTAVEALHFLARIHGRPASIAALTAALQSLGMGNRCHAPVRSLSQGQRRRVALARLALDLSAADAGGLWILDEPYDALDSDGISVVDGLLSAHARRGGGVALTSHLPLGLTGPEPTVLQLEQPKAGLPQEMAAA